MARKDKDTDAQKKKASWKEARWLYRYLRPYRFRFVAGLFFLLLTSATALAFPKMMGDLMGTAQAALTQDINRAALFLLVLFFLQAVFSYCRIYLFVHVTERLLADLRQNTYEKLLAKPMSFFSQRRVGEMNSMVATDITQLQTTLTTNIAEFLRQFIIIIGGIALLLITSWKLTLIMVSIIPPVAIVAVLFGRFIKKISTSVQDEIAVSNTILDETMQGIASVKAYTNELFEFLRYRDSTNRVVSKAMKGAVWRGFFVSFIIFCMFGSIVAILWKGIQMIGEGTMDMKLLIQFMLYTIFVGASTGGIADQYAQILKALGATERIRELQEGESEWDLVEENPQPLHLSGEVEFDHVHFSYPSRPDVVVLDDVSFKVGKGERVAIVGPSGAGKSTITALLLRFYNPDSGQIRIDGKDTTQLTLHALRSNMGIVPQEVLLFGGTIRENISYGRPGATEQEIRDAAAGANALNFIETFPDGFDTIVGERGVQLSGGQRQRIAIARALLKNPTILILDEATSSLDSESERLVQDALDKLMVGRTSIIIAHRLATVRNADKIIVLEAGKVVESGTHEELIRNPDGLYAHLSKLQFEMA
ncbi:MAG: ATP-binding cassette domain-containing protein [Flavobacteriales bacterium]|nr:ATP-binding cassette domain-containing protein [Flavobacteriales bacterium]MCB9446997.1 ATP-binding cassette domain-containing protein [Flavobacteriales bacterium]